MLKKVTSKVTSWILSIFTIFMLLMIFFVGKTLNNELNADAVEEIKVGYDTMYSQESAAYLARAYYEYTMATSEYEREAVIIYVKAAYPCLNEDSIDNDIIKDFYVMCMTE